MKYFYPLLVALSFSCGSKPETSKTVENSIEVEQTESTQKNEIKVEDEVGQYSFEGLDWNIAIKIKNDFLSTLKNEKPRGDKELVQFLKDYSNTIMKLGQQFEQSKYSDTLTQLSYQSNEDPFLKAFDEKLNKHGADIKYEEGMLFIGEHGPFITHALSNFLDSLTLVYANLYANSVDKACCADAGIMLSPKELVNRVYNWGRLAEKSEGYAFYKQASANYWSNLDLLFNGLDNTPSFDFDDPATYRDDWYQAIKTKLKSDSTSLPGKELYNFIRMLEKNDLKRTPEVSEYIASRMM